MENENKELELSERQLTILDAIIRNYLATGEPVGSRTISKYTDLNLSSATIRDERLRGDGLYSTATYFGRKNSFG